VLSYCLIEMTRPQAAMEAARTAIALAPRYAEAHNNLGLALCRLGRLDEALVASQTAVRLQPGAPANLLNQGNILRDLDRTAEALAVTERVCGLSPTLAKAHCNRGNLLQDAGRHAEALLAYDRSIELDPNDAGTHWNRALCNLLLGRHAAGWAGYEWRWKSPEARPIVRRFDCPLWLGDSDIAGKSILVHCEQGFGDALQFIRYAPLLAARGAEVHVETFAPLVELIADMPGIASVQPPARPAPPVDFHCPLMSLPLALLAQHPDVPAETPYLTPSPERRAPWTQRLAGFAKGRIGLAYAGSATHRNDHNRSIPLARFLQALPSGPDYFLLQTELRDGDAALLGSRPDIHRLSDEIRDFSDSAAICLEMDLIISVDTSIAHLAGALACPLFVLVPYDPDWRWGLNATTTPWYPTARIWRQSVRSDWGPTLKNLRADLGQRFGVTAP
jgi:regulator of sirC expression with transglutaminase-like and TPR domain